MIKAIAYDLDGVLVNACEWHHQAFNKALKEICHYEISDKEHQEIYNGLPTKRKLEILLNKKIIKENFIDEIWKLKQKYTNEIIEREAKLDYDKMLLHLYTQSLNIISICVTNCIRQTAELMLNKTGQLNFIKFVIANEDVKNNKPDPECYLLAIDKLNINKNEMIIIEDSEKGYQAGINSEIKTIKVSGTKDVNIINFEKWIS